MTQHDKDTPIQDSDADEHAPPESSEDAAQPATERLPGTESRASGSGPAAWAGTAALLLALLAAVGVGYLWLESRSQIETSKNVIGLRTELANRASELAELRGSIEEMETANAQLTQQLDSLTRQFDRQLEDIPLRISRIERTLDEIPGVDNQARSAWLLAEAEYFLRIANAQLNLAGNVDVSLRALALADQKLRDLADPGLTRVRSLLADEQTALRAVPRPDSEGIVLALGSLARSLDSLPLNRDAPGRFGQPAEFDGTESGLQRAWRKITEAFFNIISVKREDNSVTPLMSAAEESMLIRSLDIELQIGRLALIRNEKELYHRSLEAVSERLERYFDTDSPEVIAALATIEKAASAELPDELPNISGSLALLLRLGTEAASP